jgi:hypothetical protein
LALTLVLAAWTACGGGGGHSAAANPTPEPVPQPVANPTDCACGMVPVEPAFVARHGQSPVNKAILDAFTQQSHLILEPHSPFGQQFTAVNPNPAAGYTEGYFSSVHDSRCDPIERPLIRAQGVYGPALAPLFEPMYRSDPGRWNVGDTRRVSGFVFHGSKAGPKALQDSCAFYSPLFRPSKRNASLRAFQDLMNGTESARHDLRWAFDLSRYTLNTESKGFVSFTRSVQIARSFAVNIGSQGNRSNTGYVYVAYVRDGLDAADRVNLHTHFSHEQEVAAPGAVPFTYVVAYRKFERNPGSAARQAPPEFTGPVMVRDQLALLEPEACRAIVRALSVRSKFTQAYETGLDWQSIAVDTRSYPRPDPVFIWAGHH